MLHTDDCIDFRLVQVGLFLLISAVNEANDVAVRIRITVDLIHQNCQRHLLTVNSYLTPTE